MSINIGVRSFLRTTIHSFKRTHSRKKISNLSYLKNQVKMSAFVISTLTLYNTLHLVCTTLYYNHLLTFRDLTDISTLGSIAIFLSATALLPYGPSHFGFNLNRLKFNLLYGTFIGVLLLGFALFLRYGLVLAGYSSFKFNPQFD